MKVCIVGLVNIMPQVPSLLFCDTNQNVIPIENTSPDIEVLHLTSQPKLQRIKVIKAKDFCKFVQE
jgi:hypothetical protein